MINPSDGKYCPDCNSKLSKKIIKWPTIFEAYWCSGCKLDYFIDDVTILPQKTVCIGHSKKGKPKYRVFKDTSRGYNPPKLREK
jgi:hypothetical protein